METGARLACQVRLPFAFANKQAIYGLGLRGAGGRLEGHVTGSKLACQVQLPLHYTDKQSYIYFFELRGGREVWRGA
jgi:hypothetical protein